MALLKKNYVRAFKFFEFLQIQYNKYKKYALENTKNVIISIDSDSEIKEIEIDDDVISKNRE